MSVDGVIVMLPDCVKLPMPLSINIVSALMTFHCIVVELPASITGGLISKNLIKGKAPSAAEG